MEINIDTTAEDYHPIEHKKNKAHVRTYSNRGSLLFIEGIILPGLVLVALIPRIILAHQLDLVTDEIWEGKAIFLFYSIFVSGRIYGYSTMNIPPL